MLEALCAGGPLYWRSSVLEAFWTGEPSRLPWTSFFLLLFIISPPASPQPAQELSDALSPASESSWAG